MRRRKFVAFIGAGVLLPLGARAQQSSAMDILRGMIPAMRKVFALLLLSASEAFAQNSAWPRVSSDTGEVYVIAPSTSENRERISPLPRSASSTATTASV